MTEAPARRPEIPTGIRDSGIVAIARRLDAGRVDEIAEALADGGVGALEITLNEPESSALAAIGRLARPGGHPRLVVGAGTVLSVDAAIRALDAGATFLVMPHVDPAIVTFAASRGIPAFPGCATPTEALAGWRAGAAAIKLFPASVLGPAFVRELAGPFPEIPLVPTGGVTVSSAPGFIEAGAAAVGMGGWLIGDGDPAGIRSRAMAITRAIAEARSARAASPAPGTRSEGRAAPP